MGLGVGVIPDHIFNQMRSMVVEQLAALSDGSTIHCNGRLEAPGNTSKYASALQCEFYERVLSKMYSA